MKTRHQLVGISMLALLFLASCSEKKSQTNVIENAPVGRAAIYEATTIAKKLAGPGQVFAANVIIDSSFSRRGIQMSATQIYLNGSGIDPYVTEVSETELNVLYNIALGLGCSSSCGDYLAGVRITYGQKNNRLVTYFQPLYFCADGSAFPYEGKMKRVFSLCNEGINYSVNSSGGFDSVYSTAEKDEMAMNVNLYRTPKGSIPYGVEVIDPSNNLKDFYDSPTASGHAKSVVFPLKELIDIAHVKGNVKIWNAVVGTIVRDADQQITIYNKHDLMLSTSDVSINGGLLSIPKNAKFSDLSNICPPNCSGRSFTFVVPL